MVYFVQLVTLYKGGDGDRCPAETQKGTQFERDALAEVSFGEWLRRQRKAAGLTQEQLAQQVSCSTSALKKIEAEERRPSAQIVERLAEIFSVPQKERKAFLRFARGDWRAAPAGVESAPWRFSQIPERDDPSRAKTRLYTFLFTDIEGSTRLAQLYPDAMPALLVQHHEILNESIQAQNGYVFRMIGDAFCAAFPSPGDALNAALDAQRRLHQKEWVPAPIKVRMGIHTGSAQSIEDPNGAQYEGYATLALTQRIMSAAHGGQILLSQTTFDLLRDRLPEQAQLMDMGECRLKDVFQPEHIYQVVVPDLPSKFPPLNILEIARHNLPTQLTSFIGREKEIAQIKNELNDHRLITLTGSGGTGKTRLSLQVAAEVMDSFPDGVWFLDLAPVTDPTLVSHTLGNLLGLRESAESKRTITELVCGYFHSRKALLVFDNCEHLIESCARFADLLLRSCKGLKILASSREALGVAGEMAWRVPSLSLPNIRQLPPIEQLSQYEAVRLFIERATLVQPRFTVTKDNAPAIAQICCRLDGIPLAIELAAARASVLTLDQIAKRLDDRFRLLTGGARTALPRQQTLRALIDWSYNLLSTEESLLFRRLAVFVGGWTLEGAEAVCSGEGDIPEGGIESHQVLDLLSQLVKKSLVAMMEENGESRYHRLETIRQYAREKLFETDEAARIRDRHLDYFIQLAEQGFEELQGPNDLTWIEKLELEHDNFRTALSWSLESPDVDPQKALQLGSALQDFWDILGYTSEGYKWLSEALTRAPDTLTGHRCRALIGIGMLCFRLSRFKDAAAYLGDALNLARQLNIAPLIIRSLLWSGNVMEDQVESRKCFKEAIALARTTRNPPYLADSLAARPFIYADYVIEAIDSIESLEEARVIAEKLGNARLRAFVLWVYGGFERQRARYDSAISMLQESLRLSQLLKDRHSAAHCLLMLGRTTAQQTHYRDAIRYEEQALQILRDLSDQYCSAWSLLFLGWSAYLAGNSGQAIEHLEESLLIYRETDIKVEPSLPMLTLGRIAASHGNIKKAKGLFLEALELLKLQEWTYWLAQCLEGVCALPIIPLDNAATLLGKAEAIRQKEAFVIPTSERLLVDPIVEKLQSQLGKEACDSARAVGMTLSSQQASDEAIQTLQLIEQE